MRLPMKAVIETASCTVRMSVSNGSVFREKTDFLLYGSAIPHVRKKRKRRRT